ncbi:C40 family peptidase [Nonlabens ponticola]|uniref:NlpC/P60 family protein n=1 Tax=Nonlabens ponticola TaxID=2496866 RepID=A0A3S9MWM0_9FLAO|nr:C40 family peptidase [Nonlabens ponticola]AZQ43611.1 NlpC/P60 family protein [Nonlabens ponticola]
MEIFGITLSRKQNNYKSLYIAGALSLSIMFLASCGSARPKVITTKKEALRKGKVQNRSTSTASRGQDNYEIYQPEDDELLTVESNSLIDDAIENAMKYDGVRYKYGGSTRKGMDCSGLIHIAFDEAGEQVPRTSASFYAASEAIDIDEVRKGDLMFFATGRNRKKINHVALVVQVTPAEIRFVHATVSRGVTVSSFNEPYWLGRYISSGRLIP